MFKKLRLVFRLLKRIDEVPGLVAQIDVYVKALAKMNSALDENAEAGRGMELTAIEVELLDKAFDAFEPLVELAREFINKRSK